MLKAFMQLFLLIIAYFFLAVLINLGNLFSILFLVTILVLLLLPLNLLQIVHFESPSIKAVELLKSFLKSDIGIIIVLNFICFFVLLEIGFLTLINYTHLFIAALSGIIASYYIGNHWLFQRNKTKAHVFGFCLVPTLIVLFLLINYLPDSPNIRIISTKNQKIQIEPNVNLYQSNENNKELYTIDTKTSTALWGLELFNQRNLKFDSITYSYQEGFLNIPCVKINAFGVNNESIF